MKVAIVHYWLIGMRGGERVLEALSDIYPQAVIITHVLDRSSISPKLLRHEIRETFIARLPNARQWYQKYLPLMPLALEVMDMTEFDIVISSESGPAKGIIVRPDALHLCYCHSPMRYIWDQYHIYAKNAGLLGKILLPFVAHRLRIWDVSTSARVDHFIANSSFVASRIKKYYRRDAVVLNPPVAVEEFFGLPTDAVGDHYLVAGELVSYKRVDLAIEAFNKNGHKLKVVGDGNQRAILERKAGPNIEFLGRLPFEALKREFASCRALIFPGEEDFGIIPVEVMAAGRPVIAFGRGGARDTIIEGKTGMFFDQQTALALNAALENFENDMLPNLDAEAIRALAGRYSQQAFMSGWERIMAVNGGKIDVP